MRACRTAAVALAGLLVLLGTGGSDPGILLELDRERFELVARDLRTDEVGPELRVALGSPAHPTPSGVFPLRQVIESPGWAPGAHAREAGADPQPPSPRGPLGVAKIPFAQGGSIALHGGANPLVLGKPVSLGCVRSADADLLALLDWLTEQGALGAGRPTPLGEKRRSFRRPVRLVVR